MPATVPVARPQRARRGGSASADRGVLAQQREPRDQQIDRRRVPTRTRCSQKLLVCDRSDA
jgi:hypothetical protein